MAKITTEKNLFIVRYTNSGSFLVGEQTFGTHADAVAFCADRGLRVR